MAFLDTLKRDSELSLSREACPRDDPPAFIFIWAGLAAASAARDAVMTRRRIVEAAFRA